MFHPFRIQSFPTLIVLFALLLSSAACRKNNEDDTVLVTETEAAEIAETALAAPSAGLALATTETAKTVAASSQICGATYDTTWQGSKTTALYSYNQQSVLHWSIQCANLVPQSAQATLTGNGTFATGRWSGDNEASGSLLVTGLQPQSTNYTVSGSYTRTGDLTGALRNADPTLHCVTTVTLTTLTLNKSNYQITGGTGNVTVVATAGNGKSKTLNGTLTFNGDGTATVVINGHTHTFSF